MSKYMNLSSQRDCTWEVCTEETILVKSQKKHQYKTKVCHITYRQSLELVKQCALINLKCNRGHVWHKPQMAFEQKNCAARGWKVIVWWIACLRKIHPKILKQRWTMQHENDPNGSSKSIKEWLQIKKEKKKRKINK